MSIKSKIRISRCLAKAGLASRREAEKLILDGRVTLNGKTINGLDATDGFKSTLNTVLPLNFAVKLFII